MSKTSKGLLCKGGPWSGLRLRLRSDESLDFSVPSYNNGEVGRYARRGLFYVWVPRDA